MCLGFGDLAGTRQSQRFLSRPAINSQLFTSLLGFFVFLNIAHAILSHSQMSFPFRIVEHVVPGQYIREYPRATSTSQEETLHLAVKQYIPLDNPNPKPGDVTIIAAHANGFPKVGLRQTSCLDL